MSHVLTRASRELSARGDDEVFRSLQDLFNHCQREREQSMDCREMPRRLQPLACPDGLLLNLGPDGAFQMNDWSFGQLCRLAKVNRETVNRVSADTATRPHASARDSALVEGLVGEHGDSAALTADERIVLKSSLAKIYENVPGGI